MKYQLRDYQKQASDAAVRAFNGKAKRNGLLILPTGSGKSLIIADIASRLDGPLLVFQPSKEACSTAACIPHPQGARTSTV